MKNNFEFDVNTYNEILKNVFLTEIEKNILELKRKYSDDWNNSRIAMELNMSERHLYRKYLKIMDKICKYLGS